MTDKELTSKLKRFVKLGNELHLEAKSRYGPEGMLFHEAGGGISLMDGDDESSSTRQRHVRESNPGALWAIGCW
jgi:hypothetical protein